MAADRSILSGIHDRINSSNTGVKARWAASDLYIYKLGSAYSVKFYWSPAKKDFVLLYQGDKKNIRKEFSSMTEEECYWSVLRWAKRKVT